MDLNWDDEAVDSIDIVNHNEPTEKNDSANQLDNSDDCIRIFGIARDSIVDGPGVRYAVFTQGCPHHCAGCQNPGSWSECGGEQKSCSEIIDEIKHNGLLAGVTLTGGDPFAQAEKLCGLVDGIRSSCPRLDVWAWSGWTFEQLASGKSARAASLEWWRFELLKRCDVLVDGQFIESMKTLAIPWRGSSNQRVIRVKESLDAGRVVLHEDN